MTSIKTQFTPAISFPEAPIPFSVSEVISFLKTKDLNQWQVSIERTSTTASGIPLKYEMNFAGAPISISLELINDALVPILRISGLTVEHPDTQDIFGNLTSQYLNEQKQVLQSQSTALNTLQKLSANPLSFATHFSKAVAGQEIPTPDGSLRTLNEHDLIKGQYFIASVDNFYLVVFCTPGKPLYQGYFPMEYFCLVISKNENNIEIAELKETSAEKVFCTIETEIKNRKPDVLNFEEKVPEKFKV